MNFSQGCKVLFIAPEIGRRSLAGHVQAVLTSLESNSTIRHVVSLDESSNPGHGPNFRSYTDFLNCGQSVFINDRTLDRAERKVVSSDVVNLQFTSGQSHQPRLWIIAERHGQQELQGSQKPLL